MRSAPLSTPFVVFGFIGLALSISSAIVLAFTLSVRITRKVSLRSFRIESKFIIPNPLNIFLICSVYIIPFLIFSCIRVSQYGINGNPKGLNLIITQLYFAGGLPIGFCLAIGFILASLELDLRVNASALTPDSNSSDPGQLPWYLSHLKYPWLSNSFLFLGLLFLAVELPLLVVSDCKLERAFQMNSDMAKLTNPIQIKILNEMIQTQLASAEELFKVYCGLETIGNFIVTVLSAYYLFYHFHSESFRIFGVPAVTAWVLLFAASCYVPINIFFAIKSEIFMPGVSDKSIKAIIISCLLSAASYLAMHTAVLLFSLKIIPRRESLLNDDGEVHGIDFNSPVDDKGNSV